MLSTILVSLGIVVVSLLVAASGAALVIGVFIIVLSAFGPVEPAFGMGTGLITIGLVMLPLSLAASILIVER